MSDGFNLLEQSPIDGGNVASENGGNDFLTRFGAVDIGGDSGSGGNGGSSSRDSGDDFDPTIHVGRDKRNADGSFTKRRGRKSAGGNSGSRVSKGAASVKSIQTALEGIHALAAAFTGFDDIRLSEDESGPLAQGIANVARHYNIPAVDPRFMDTIALVMIAGKVYLPKAALIKMEIAERKSKSKPKKGEVVTFPGSFTPPPAESGFYSPDVPVS